MSQVTICKAIRVLWGQISVLVPTCALTLSLGCQEGCLGCAHIDRHPAVPTPCAGPCVDLAVAVALSYQGLWVTHVGHICAGALNSAKECTQGLYLHNFWWTAQSTALDRARQSSPNPSASAPWAGHMLLANISKDGGEEEDRTCLVISLPPQLSRWVKSLKWQISVIRKGLACSPICKWLQTMWGTNKVSQVLRAVCHKSWHFWLQPRTGFWISMFAYSFQHL